MNYAQLLKALGNSHPGDWHYIPGHSGSGDSLAYSVGMVNGQVEIESHPHRAVYRDDIALTIAYGIELESIAEPTWNDTERRFVEAVADKPVEAKFTIIDVFWNGALVHREPFWVIGSDRAWCPVWDSFYDGPDGPETRSVDTWRVKFLETVEQLETGTASHKYRTIRHALERLEVEIV